MEKEDLEFINSQTKDTFCDVKLSIITKCIDNNEALATEIKNFLPADGWISTQSTPAYRIQNSEFDIGDEHILAGEFYNSEKRSLSVRFNGDKWILTTYNEALDGELVLKQNVRQLSKIKDNVYLNYAVFYKYNTDFGYRPYCSAFIGFTEGK